MRLRYGIITVELPKDWRDCSTLLFVGPPTERDASLPALNRQSPSAPSVAVQLVKHDGPPDALLARQIAELTRLGSTYELLGEGAFDARAGRAWSCSQRIQIDGRWVRQLSVAISLGGAAILATASATAELFELARERLEGIIRSIEVEEGS
jgi:hypothetical protein